MMRIFDFFRTPAKRPAEVARERLQIVLAHERVGRDGGDVLPELQREILAVIARYLPIDDDKVLVKVDRGSNVSTLEVNVELPAGQPLRRP